MNVIRLCHAVVIGLLLCNVPAIAVNASYRPRIPTGHSAAVVLHVDYGNAPGNISIRSAVDEVHYEATGIEGLRVVGDRFYFIDDTSGTVRCYRAPGAYLWQTQKLKNLHYLAVAPDGTAYVAWGTKVDKLSRIDLAGRLMWTADYGDLLSSEQVRKLGLRESYGSFGWLEWTALGLSITLDGLDESAERRSVAVLIDQAGKSAVGLPGFLADTDGITYSYTPVKRQGDFAALRMVGKDTSGQVRKEVVLDFGSDYGQAALSGHPAFLRMRTTPDGGFVAEGNALLTEKHALTSAIQTGLEHILWVFDGSGKLKQEWRVLASLFSHRYQEISVGSDAKVYQLRYTDTGIDVLKYSRTPW